MRLLRGQRQPMWYAVTAIVISTLLTSLVIGVSGSIYTQRQIHRSEQRAAAARAENDRRWCALLVQLDDTLPATSQIKPPIHKLRGQFGCDER